MPRSEIVHTLHFELVDSILQEQGLLLVSGQDKPNPMTIGWGTLGTVWSRPMWAVLVRPSRHTYKLIEETGDFTVNVPTRGMSDACSVCGSVSGRNEDKFESCKLTAAKSNHVKSAYIAQCPMHYECRVVLSCDVDPARLDKKIEGECYPKGDFHRIYFGEVLGAYAEDDVVENLSP